MSSVSTLERRGGHMIDHKRFPAITSIKPEYRLTLNARDMETRYIELKDEEGLFVGGESKHLAAFLDSSDLCSSFTDFIIFLSTLFGLKAQVTVEGNCFFATFSKK